MPPHLLRELPSGLIASRAHEKEKGTLLVGSAPEATGSLCPSPEACPVTMLNGGHFRRAGSLLYSCRQEPRAGNPGSGWSLPCPPRVGRVLQDGGPRQDWNPGPVGLSLCLWALHLLFPQQDRRFPWVSSTLGFLGIARSVLVTCGFVW